MQTRYPQSLLASQRPLFRAISQTMEEAAREGGRMVTIRGRPGSGKSTLLRALEANEPQRSQLIIGAQWSQQVPYAALRQLGISPKEFAAEAGEQKDPAHRLALAEKLIDLHRSADEAPPIILFDDPHLADTASLQVLSQLGRHIRSTSTVLVVAVNTSAQPSMDHDFSRLVDEPAALRLSVPALQSDDVVALARSRGFADIDSQGVAVLLEYSGGRLRMVEEMLTEVPRGAWPTDPNALPLPDSVVQEVLDPIRRSGSEHLWSLACALSVLDEPSDLTRIGQIADLEDLTEAMDLGVASSVLRELRSVGTAMVRLSHPAARRVILDQMLPSERRRLHARAAAYVENPENSLIHRAAAAPGEDAELAAELRQAAVSAEYLGRWKDAARLHFAASGALPSSPEREIQLLSGIDALASAGTVAEVLPWLAVAKGFAPSPERDVVLANVALHRGKAAEADDLLHRAEEAQPHDSDLHAQIALRRTLDSLVRWDGPALCRWAERAMDLSPAESPAHIESGAMHGLGLAAQTRLDEASEAVRQLAQQNVPGAQSQRFHLCVGWVALLAGELRDAARALESAVPTQQLRGSLRISLWAQGWLARVQFMLGEWDDALRTAEEGLQQCHAAGIDLVAPLLNWTAAEVRLCRGQPTDEVLGGPRSRAFFSDYLAMQVPERCTRAISAQVRGDHEGRAAALLPLLDEDPWDASRISFWPWQAELVDALIAADNHEHAHQVAAQFRRHTSGASGFVQGLAQTACARAAGAAGDISEAEAHFSSALGLLGSDQHPTERARVLLSRGQVLRRANRRREAMESLQRAREFYLGVGAKVLVERCEQELRATGMSWGNRASGPPGTSRTGDSAVGVMLTPQELSVADLVVQGRTNAEVARELFIAEKTVQYHLTRIYGKFRIRSRTELAAVHFSEDPETY